MPNKKVASVILAGASLLLVAGCKNGPPSPSPVPIPGATMVRGTERLAWSQAGDVSGLRFRAYVDDSPMSLDAAVCDSSTPEATCTSPLPPLTNGVHTIALTTVLTTFGLESERSEALLVQKVPAGPARLASIPDADGGKASLGLQATVQLADDLAFTAEVVARGILAPAQLAWLPDGRLLVAEADGGVRVVHPGLAPRRNVRAIDPNRPRRLLGPASTGPMGLAAHPAFAQNGFAYAALLATDRPGFSRLRVVRLREVGDTLGDPATLFEASVIDDRNTPAAARAENDSHDAPHGAPRLAFGPDGLLYIALPVGFLFDREPAASVPHASMLRLRDDGLPAGAMTGIRSHPLAFTWDPATGLFLPAFAEGNDDEVAGPTALPPSAFSPVLNPLRLPVTYRTTGLSNALVIGDVGSVQVRELTRSILGVRGRSSPSAVRLTMPIASGSMADRIGDIVPGADGTWFVVTSNAARAGGGGRGEDDVVVRLTPILR